VPGPDTYTLVDSKAALDAMTAALASEVELAVDVEHHSWRSFQGLTCLMQVTGRAGHDYLVDVLSPDVRPHVGQALGPLFTNPHVCKVLHGADSDVLWLQRDLGLYIVNLFDTYRAARRLAYPATSLGYLLTRLCGYVEKALLLLLLLLLLRPLPYSSSATATTNSLTPPPLSGTTARRPRRNSFNSATGGSARSQRGWQRTRAATRTTSCTATTSCGGSFGRASARSPFWKS